MILTQRHKGTEGRKSIASFSVPLCLCVMFLHIADILNSAVGGEIDPIKIALLADEMANRGSGYDATELHALGENGLTAVLDYLLPDTAPPRKLPEGPPVEEIQRLIAKLDADDFRVREAATEELIARAKARRKLIEEGATS